MYSRAFKREAIRDARALGVRAAARIHGVDRKTLRRWRELADLRDVQLTAEELALLERDDLGPKDLPALTRMGRATDFLLTGTIDPADVELLT